MEKSIRAELVKAAPNSSLAKHKSRQRKPAAAVDSDANVTCFFTTVFAHDRVNASLREFSTFQFFEAVNEATTVKLKRFSLANLTPKEREFYEQKVCVSHEKAKQVCQRTVTQSCTLWHSERRKRITGSVCRELYTFSETEKYTWEAKLNRMYCRDSFVGNKATAYGIMNEPVALEEYEATHQAKVSRLGLVISPEVPWLGYSPDGISRQRNMKILLEVKCPVLGKNHSIVNLVKEKKLPYIVLDGEKYVLKLAHKYYSQVQLGMLVLNMDICHFVVFSKVSSLVVEVPRDRKHMRDLLSRLQFVYFKKILPKLVSIAAE